VTLRWCWAQNWAQSVAVIATVLSLLQRRNSTWDRRPPRRFGSERIDLRRDP